MSESTKGPWVVNQYGTLVDYMGETALVRGVAWPSGFDSDRGKMNRDLLREALNTKAETGLTPRQMQEQIKELRGALRGLLAFAIANTYGGDDVSRLIEAARSALAKTERKTA